MITKVVLAKLSPTMEEGTIVKWSKKEGDAVKVGDVLAEIETDKANMEMEALGAGVLRTVLVPAGGKAPVGALIGVIADAGRGHLGDAGRSRCRGPGGGPRSGVRPDPVASRCPGRRRAGPGVAARPARRARRRSRRPGGRVKASPLARAIAAQRNVPLASVAGSGPGGRIVKRDVEGYLAAPPAAAPAGKARRRPGSPRRSPSRRSCPAPRSRSPACAARSRSGSPRASSPPRTST